MQLTFMSDVSYKSQDIHHTIQILGKTVTVIHEQNSKQRAECTLTDDCFVTLDDEGATIYFDEECDFVKVVTMINEFNGEKK